MNRWHRAIDENAANHAAKRDLVERMHHWMDQIVELYERDAAGLLAEALRDSLPDELLLRVVECLSDRRTLENPR